MNFVEKIDKLLKSNTLGISSPSALEDYIKAGRGSITTPYRNKDSPGLRTQKKIIEKLRINPEWWETGKGEIYQNVKVEAAPQTSFRDEIFEGDYIGMHNRVWTQHELTMSMQRELLKTLVDKLVNSPKANGQKR